MPYSIPNMRLDLSSQLAGGRDDGGPGRPPGGGRLRARAAGHARGGRPQHGPHRWVPLPSSNACDSTVGLLHCLSAGCRPLCPASQLWYVSAQTSAWAAWSGTSTRCCSACRAASSRPPSSCRCCAVQSQWVSCRAAQTIVTTWHHRSQAGQASCWSMLRGVPQLLRAAFHVAKSFDLSLVLNALP